MRALGSCQVADEPLAVILEVHTTAVNSNTCKCLKISMLLGGFFCFFFKLCILYLIANEK